MDFSGSDVCCFVSAIERLSEQACSTLRVVRTGYCVYKDLC